MVAPSPDQLSRTVADILDLLSRGVEVGGQGSRNQSRRESVDQAYRWMHTAGYDRKVGGEATSLICSKCDGSGWVDDVISPPLPVYADPVLIRRRRRCEACTPSVGSDPTGDTIVAREDVMRALNKVGGYMTAGREAIADAISELQGIVGKVDQGVRVEPMNERAIPRTATKKEVAKANAANQRRQERGEGYGVG